MNAMIQAAASFWKIQLREHESREDLRNDQFKELKRVLSFAAARIPYYNARFEAAGISPGAIRSWNDFAAVPFLSKQELRSRPVENFLPEFADLCKAWTSQTTGSSGIPVTIYRTGESDAWNKALIHYGMSALGIRLTHRLAQLLAVVPEKPNPPGFLAKLHLKRFFPVSLKQADGDIIGQLNEIKPEVIYTFPSVFQRLAESLEQGGLKFKPKWLVAQGEVLLSGWREQIERAFGARLYHTYGATEFPRIGFECREQRGFHLPVDAAVVEVLDEEGRPVMDREGEIVLTHLHNFCMPLIRYRIGDRGILSSRECPCGIHYPLLENVTGRMDDFLILPSGQKVSARAVTHMQFPGILQYKIIQKRPSHIQVLVVPTKGFGESTLREIRQELAAGCLGEEIFVEILETDTLPVSRTGKLQIVSREF